MSDSGLVNDWYAVKINKITGVVKKKNPRIEHVRRFVQHERRGDNNTEGKDRSGTDSKLPSPSTAHNLPTQSQS